MSKYIKKMLCVFGVLLIVVQPMTVKADENIPSYDDLISGSDVVTWMHLYVSGGGFTGSDKHYLLVWKDVLDGTVKHDIFIKETTNSKRNYINSIVLSCYRQDGSGIGGVSPAHFYQLSTNDGTGVWNDIGYSGFYGLKITMSSSSGWLSYSVINADIKEDVYKQNNSYAKVLLHDGVIVTPTPTPTSTPTPVPVPDVDVENSGIAELFDGVLRIFNVKMKVEGIEFTWWQIFIYLILAGLVLDLVFAPSDK